MLGNPILPHVFQGIWTTMTSDKRVISQLASYHAEDMNYLAGLISGKKIKVVIDKTYSLENIQQAHQYVEDGHKAGNVVVRIVA
jgi:NADPH:quinone reductase-like Zn-dependent oxidoreductase